MTHYHGDKPFWGYLELIWIKKLYSTTIRDSSVRLSKCAQNHSSNHEVCVNNLFFNSKLLRQF